MAKKKIAKRKSPPAVLVRMDEGLLAAVEERAQRERVSREGWIRGLIEQTLEVQGLIGRQQHR